jgi:hypothetical protein
MLLSQVFSDDEKRIQTGSLILGRVRRFHVRKDLLGPTGQTDTGKMLPVSRLGGITYGRTTEAYGERLAFHCRVERVRV